MCGPIGVSRMKHAIMVGLLTVLVAEGGQAIAQDAPLGDLAASPRERELRDQLKNILQELEDLQQKKDREKPEEARPSILTSRHARSLVHAEYGSDSGGLVLVVRQLRARRHGAFQD